MTIDNTPDLNLMYQALAHETRREILARLIAEPGVNAGTFVAQFDVAQPTISRHLLQLERAGLVSRQVHGRSHVFFANPDALNASDSWLSQHRDFWSGSLQRLGRFLDKDDT